VLNQQQGEVTIPALAGATAQRERVVELGLQWLEAKGALRITRREHNQVWLSAGSAAEAAELAQVSHALGQALDETAAYRQYFAKTDKDKLLDLG